MDPDRWGEIQEIFLDAQDLAPEARGAFLDEACADDPDLRTEVEGLLAADLSDDGLLDSTLDDLVLLLEDDEEADAALHGVGEAVGPYRLLGQIGRGGMGVVYQAEREDEHFTRTVALKVVSGRATSAETARRFQREQRILAGLEHPNIARLYDAGVAADGTPWLAMELVRGEPVHRYCERLGLDAPRRLELFEQVVTAVEYAHRNLVVHRDLKPSNILVTADGQAKLLDFGIAKLLGEEGPDPDDPLTRMDQRVLTPEYASPEQIAGKPLTTASDVYSLGLLLHRIVTDRAAERRGDGTVDVQAASAGREVDAIIRKATRAEESERYPTAAALLDDLVRFRKALPLAARPPSLAYRARKFARRNRAAVLGATAFLLLLAVSAVVLWRQRSATLREFRRAQEEAAKAVQVTQFLKNMLAASHPGATRGDSVTVRQVLDASALRLAEGELDDQPSVKVELLQLMAEVYRALGSLERSRDMLEEARVLHGATPGLDPLLLADVLNELGNVEGNLAENEAAERHYLEALEIRRRGRAPGPASELSEVLQNLGLHYANTGRLEEAEDHLRQAVEMDRALMVEDTSGALGYSLNSLAILRYQQGDLPEAADLLEEALDIRRRTYGPLHPRVSTTLGNLAAVLSMTGQHARADPILREALEMNRRIHGSTHPDVASSLQNVAANLSELGRDADAEPLFLEALAMNRELLGADHPEVAINLHGLGLILRDRGEHGRALELIREGLDISERRLGPAHLRTGILTNALGSVYRAMGACDEAEPLYRRALEIFGASQPDDSFRIADVRSGLASCLTARGAFEEAETLLLAAYPVLLEQQGEANRLTVTARRALFDLYTAWGRPGDALGYAADPTG